MTTTAKPPQISALRESLGELAPVLSMTLDCPTSKAIGKEGIWFKEFPSEPLNGTAGTVSIVRTEK
jgi:hypothetical protein